jgi:uncharacterized coiled-coil protein SlyX
LVKAPYSKTIGSYYQYSAEKAVVSGKSPHYISKSASEVVAMVDASFSRQRQMQDGAPAGARRQLSIFAVGLAVILISLGWVLVQRGFGSGVGSPSIVATARDELVETTKGLQATQQQAVDQLQVVQDQLVAQKEQTKKLSEQIAIMNEKLEAMQQSTPPAPAKSR